MYKRPGGADVNSAMNEGADGIKFKVQAAEAEKISAKVGESFLSKDTSCEASGGACN